MQERLKFQVVLVHVCSFPQGSPVNWNRILRVRNVQRDLLRVFAFIAKINAVTIWCKKRHKRNDAGLLELE